MHVRAAAVCEDLPGHGTQQVPHEAERCRGQVCRYFLSRYCVDIALHISPWQLQHEPELLPAGRPGPGRGGPQEEDGGEAHLAVHLETVPLRVRAHRYRAVKKAKVPSQSMFQCCWCLPSSPSSSWRSCSTPTPSILTRGPCLLWRRECCIQIVCYIFRALLINPI